MSVPDIVGVPRLGALSRHRKRANGQEREIYELVGNHAADFWELQCRFVTFAGASRYGRKRAAAARRGRVHGRRNIAHDAVHDASDEPPGRVGTPIPSFTERAGAPSMGTAGHTVGSIPGPRAFQDLYSAIASSGPYHLNMYYNRRYGSRDRIDRGRVSRARQASQESDRSSRRCAPCPRDPAARRRTHVGRGVRTSRVQPRLRGDVGAPLFGRSDWPGCTAGTAVRSRFAARRAWRPRSSTPPASRRPMAPRTGAPAAWRPSWECRT